MRIPKRYGQSKVDNCPFCGKQATTYNSQKVPVCRAHQEKNLGEMKCSCGSWLEMRNGKFGIFFSCIRCGNLNLRKVLEINPPIASKNIEKPSKTTSRAVETVTPDDPRYFD